MDKKPKHSFSTSDEFDAYQLISYGFDFTVQTLVKQIDGGDIYAPEFQRGFVWTRQQASRFIESLLLGYPVPGIFLAREPHSRKLVIVDGLQRLLSLHYFYHETFNGNKYFKLKGLSSRFDGYSYSTLPAADRYRLDDAIIHAVVIQMDKESDYNVLFDIFERLNSPGTPLNDQEFRSALFGGTFIDLIKQLNDYSNWRSIYGPPDKRRKDEELILRFLALNSQFGRYRPPMRQFLNEFLIQNSDSSTAEMNEMSHTFQATVDVVAEALGTKAFRPNQAFSASVFDAVMVGLARNQEKLSASDPSNVLNIYTRLIRDERFVSFTRQSTDSEKNVVGRIRLAIDFFSRLQ